MNYRNSSDTTRDRELTPAQRAGDRFGVTAVAFALLAGLCTAFPDLEPVAWALDPIALALGGTGLMLWMNGRATNRDDALIGTGLAYLVVTVLLCTFAASHPVPAEWMLPPH